MSFYRAQQLYKTVQVQHICLHALSKFVCFYLRISYHACTNKHWYVDATLILAHETLKLSYCIEKSPFYVCCQRMTMLVCSYVSSIGTLHFLQVECSLGVTTYFIHFAVALHRSTKLITQSIIQVSNIAAGDIYL